MQSAKQGSSAESTSAASKKQPAWLYKRVGRYKLLALLGEGAIGKVFRAEDLELGRQVALKVISVSAGGAKPLHTVDGALSEARLAAGLEHPHIVHVYEVGKASSFCYIAMELVDGGSLREIVKAGGPMDYPRACQLVADAAEALNYSHEQGVIHRDVKPANLMLSRGGRCKLADFGLAVLHTSQSDGQDHDRPAGTPQFMAPEVIRGNAATGQSDLYSLGATLWYLLSGNPPFVAETAGEILEKHLNEPLPDLMKLRADLPQGLVQGIAKALEKDPAKRFATGEQFARFLRVYTIPLNAGGSSMTSLLTGSEFVPQAPRPAPSALRKPVLFSGLAALIGVSAMTASVYWYFGGWTHPSHHSSQVQPVAYPIAPINKNTMPSGVYHASDTVALAALASANSTTQPTTHPAEITVEGIVASNQVSKHAKYFRITFIGSEASGSFVCTYKPELLPALQARFGGTDGPGLQGKHIRVTGKIEMFKDRPTVQIETIEQIRLLP